MNIDELWVAWDTANQAKVQAQETELKLRLQLAEECFGYDPDQLEKATLRHPLPNGYRGKCELKINENLEQNEVPNAKQALLELGVQPEFVNAVFREKYSINKAIYNALPQPAQDVIDSITTKTAATPAITIETPKQKRYR